MRLSRLLCISGLLHATLAAALNGSAFYTVGLRPSRRALDGLGLLNGLDGNSDTTHHDIAKTSAVDDSGTSVTASFPFVNTALSTKKPKTTDPIPTGTSYYVIGSIPPLTSPGTTSANTSPTANTAPSSPSSTVSTSAQSSNATTSTGTSEWKIIGVAVIAFSTVAAILLLSVFFDHWWRFVKDLVWRKRKKESEEELVPDWEKAEWELRLAKNSERYPSFTSLPSSLPSGHTMHAQAQNHIHSPPQAVLGRSASRREAQPQAGGHMTQLDPAFVAGPSTSRRAGSGIGYAGIGVGLGLGHVGSVSSGAPAVSPLVGQNVGRTSPLRPSPRQEQGNVSEGRNPFEDHHSPTPDDVYVGVLY